MSNAFFSRQDILNLVNVTVDHSLVGMSLRVCSEAWIRYITADPQYHQPNFLVQNSVKIMKYLLNKAAELHSDPYLSLLHHRTGPVKHGLLSADILFKRKLRTSMSVQLEIGVRVTKDSQKSKKTGKAKKTQKYGIWCHESCLRFMKVILHFWDRKQTSQTSVVSQKVGSLLGVVVTPYRDILQGMR